MSITERLANLDIWTVLIIIAALFGLRFALRKRTFRGAKAISETVESLAIAMGLVFLLIRPFIVQAFFIPSPSMHPTLLEDDHILVNKLLYRIVREPRVGDVIVFQSPPEAASDEKDFIKRVIAVPGDMVRVTAGRLWIGKAELNHQAVRELLEQRLDVRLTDGAVLENGKEVPKSEIAVLAGLPNAQVAIDSKRAMVGASDYGADGIRVLLAQRHRVKLTPKGVYWDGVKISNEEIAKLAHIPGAKIRVCPGTVYLNGKPLAEPYTAEDADAAYPSSDSRYLMSSWIQTGKDGVRVVKLPKDKYLVMGDNRNDSNDGRFWGPLSRDRVLGKTMFIFWPLNRIRWVH